MAIYKEEGYRLNSRYTSGGKYQTPWPTFRFWNRWMIDHGYHCFNLDPFSSKQDHRTPRCITRKQNGFIADWREYVAPSSVRAWVNPPYSEIPQCTEKVVFECRRGCTAGTLLPGWGFGDPWCAEDVARYSSEIIYIKGRIRFIGAPGKPSYRASFSSAFILWLPGLRPAGTEIRTSWIDCPLT
jgi:hypothetical protein